MIKKILQKLIWYDNYYKMMLILNRTEPIMKRNERWSESHHNTDWCLWFFFSIRSRTLSFLLIQYFQLALKFPTKWKLTDSMKILPFHGNPIVWCTYLMDFLCVSVILASNAIDNYIRCIWLFIFAQLLGITDFLQSFYQNRILKHFLRKKKNPML